MRTSTLLSSVVLLLIAAIALACGSSSMSGSRAATALTITPATAEGMDFPGGVPFSATASYSAPPSPVKGVRAVWGACYQNNPTSDISVSTSGMAHCGPGASGTYTVWAYVIANNRGCPEWVNSCGGGGCQVTGTAQLTCP